MELACQEAERAFGRTSPNPLVGAVAVRSDAVISSGFHKKAGEAHAEVNCLNDDIDYSGATLYVTLEPCSTHGRTPPCTEKVIKSGVKEVIIGNLDPNPEHAGRAVKILENAGIKVRHSILKERCWGLNIPFYKWIQTGKPLVHLKMAMTLDGKIATEKGQSQWITGPDARQAVQEMRKECDGIMVGGETILQDNSSLRVQDKGWPQPQRFIWSSRTDWDKNLKSLQNDDGKAALTVKPQTALEWNSFLKSAGDKEISCLLLEGGGELAASALQAGIVDKVSFFIAPKLLCGRESRPVTGGKNPDSLNDALQLKNMKYKNFGNDLMAEGWLSEIWKCP